MGNEPGRLAPGRQPEPASHPASVAAWVESGLPAPTSQPASQPASHSGDKFMVGADGRGHEWGGLAGGMVWDAGTKIRAGLGGGKIEKDNP